MVLAAVLFVPLLAWSFGVTTGLWVLHDGDGKQWWLRGPARGSGNNFTSLWSRLRVPLQLSASPSSVTSAGGFRWQAPDSSGFIVLSVNDDGSSPNSGTNADNRLCLTAQSNTIADVGGARLAA